MSVSIAFQISPGVAGPLDDRTLGTKENRPTDTSLATGLWRYETSGTATTGETPWPKWVYYDGTSWIDGFPPTAPTDFSSLAPNDMITLDATNRYWGVAHTYMAATALESGRVVALTTPFTNSVSPFTDEDDYNFVVGYVQKGTEEDTRVVPIGVTQNACNAGENVVVCVSGYTTVDVGFPATASYIVTGSSAPPRGSQVYAGRRTDRSTTYDGRVIIATTSTGSGSGDEHQGRIGFTASRIQYTPTQIINSQSTVGHPRVLIYVRPWFEPRGP